VQKKDEDPLTNQNWLDSNSLERVKRSLVNVKAVMEALKAIALSAANIDEFYEFRKLLGMSCSNLYNLTRLLKTEESEYENSEEIATRRERLQHYTKGLWKYVSKMNMNWNQIQDEHDLMRLKKQNRDNDFNDGVNPEDIEFDYREKIPRVFLTLEEDKSAEPKVDETTGKRIVKYVEPKWQMVDSLGHVTLTSLPQIIPKKHATLEESLTDGSLVAMFAEATRDTPVIESKDWLLDPERSKKFPLNPARFEKYEDYVELLGFLARYECFNRLCGRGNRKYGHFTKSLRHQDHDLKVRAVDQHKNVVQSWIGYVDYDGTVRLKADVRTAEMALEDFEYNDGLNF
jgi:hypothetical protein